MNVVKQINITNDDSDLIEKLEQLNNEYWAENYENAEGYGRCYNARRRYYRFLNKLSGDLGGTEHMLTGSGWNKTLVIGN